MRKTTPSGEDPTGGLSPRGRSHKWTASFCGFRRLEYSVSLRKGASGYAVCEHILTALRYPSHTP